MLLTEIDKSWKTSLMVIASSRGNFNKIDRKSFIVTILDVGVFVDGWQDLMEYLDKVVLDLW